MSKNINIVALAGPNEKYLKEETPKFCLSSGNRIIESCNKCGYTAEIKIISTLTKEWEEFSKNSYYKVLEEKFNKNEITKHLFVMRISDLFRIGYLSEYPYTLYLDTDIYVSKDFNFMEIEKYDPYLPYFGYVLYNNSNTGIFKKILNYYNNNTFKNLESDKGVSTGLYDNANFKFLNKTDKVGSLIHIPFTGFTKNNTPVLNIVIENNPIYIYPNI